MASGFDTALKAKFDKGHQEHETPWDLDHIDAISEIQDECLDIYNYASLLDDDLSREIQGMAKYYWKRLELAKSKKK